MIYEERGRIFTKLPVQRGTSGTGKEWSKQDMVFETEGNYPKKICVTFFNDKADQLVNLNNNDLVTVSFVVESREYQGRWFSNINGTAINAVVEGSDSGLQTFKANDRPNFTEPEEDDLPF